MNPKIKELLEQACKLSDNQIEVQEIIDLYFSNGSKFTIEDLRNGKCAVINDGTLQELQKVLKLAFPNLTTAKKGNKHLYSRFLGGWSDGNYGGLPTQSVKDFLKKENMQTNVSNNSNDPFDVYKPVQISRRDYFAASIYSYFLKEENSLEDAAESTVKAVNRIISELDKPRKI